jgi:DNA-directed RNA polymerase specialized sigma24 family protein
MLEIYRRWAEIKSAEAYANFTVACRATDYLKLSSRTVVSDEADLARLGQPLTADLPDGVLFIEGEQLVLEALSQLPPLQRAVFALVYDEYSIADIAAILKLKDVTTRSHLRHARSTLRTWWGSRTAENPGRGRP